MCPFRTSLFLYFFNAERADSAPWRANKPNEVPSESGIPFLLTWHLEGIWKVKLLSSPLWPVRGQYFPQTIVPVVEQGFGVPRIPAKWGDQRGTDQSPSKALNSGLPWVLVAGRVVLGEYRGYTSRPLCTNQFQRCRSLCIYIYISLKVGLGPQRNSVFLVSIFLTIPKKGTAPFLWQHYQPFVGGS